MNIGDIRKRFPVLEQKVNGYDLIYFDNAATTQKPVKVLRALNDYYSTYNANIHRGIHTLAEKATAAFEDTRETVRDFINARETEEIIFTSGTTDSINLVASSWGRANLQPGDEVILSEMEHHSNIVPWQMICEEKEAKLRIIGINEDGELEMDHYRQLLNEKTRLVSIAHVSNSLGTINPVKEIIAEAHNTGALVMLDGAQAAAHSDIDVQDLDCDFYAFSGHKVYGPTGTGVLYGKRSLLESMPPYRGGGEMIREVRFEKTTFNDLPYKFEAGTPNIAGFIAFNEALEFINALRANEPVGKYEELLLQHATGLLQEIPGLKIIGKAKNKIAVISFIVKNIHHYDLGLMLDAKGIAVRTGHHCSQPLMDHFGIDGTSRVSFAVYNTTEEINVFAEQLSNLIHKWKR